MVEVVLALAAGVGAGVLLRGRDRVRQAADGAVTVLVVALLFLLGASVGADRTVISALPGLGLQAAALAASATLGSVLLASLVLPLRRSAS